MKCLLFSSSPVLIKCAFTEGSRLSDIVMDSAKKPSIVGNIYLGVVENIVHNKFAFIDIGVGKPGFLQLDDKKQSGITDMRFKKGKPVIVQAVKDAYGEKGAYLSTELTFAGRYCVLVKRLDKKGNVNVSSKITDDVQISRLKCLAAPLCKEGYGLIIRTESLDAAEDDIVADISATQAKAEKLINEINFAAFPQLLKQENSFLNSSVSLLRHKPDRVICDSRYTADIVNPILSARGYYNTEIYKGSMSLFAAYGVDKQLKELFVEKVWLKSGGFLLIEEGKTAVFIDVNSGKNIKPASVLKLNTEAAVEIFRQIRLRNLSGVIIVDFIGMSDNSDRKVLFEACEKFAKLDSVKTVVAEYNNLEIMYITRKKERLSIKEQFTVNCKICGGTGYESGIEIISDRIYWEVKSLLEQTQYRRFKISINRAAAKEIAENGWLDRLGMEYGAEISIDAIETYRADYYNINRE